MRPGASSFCYHPAVAWAGFLLLFSFLSMGETLEDGARAVARSTTVHLSPSERAHVTLHNLTALSNAEAARIQIAFERAMRRNPRNPKTVEVTLTISDNVKGYLLVAEIFHGDERAVEMTSVPREPSIAPAPAGITITKKLLWEQSAPILDVALVADFMFVLDTSGVSRYERREGTWDRVGVLQAASSVRDPRGRLALEGDSLTIQLPGTTCRGTWNPTVSQSCDAGSMLTAARNQLQGVCAANPIAATSATYGDAADSIALYEVVNNAPVRLSDPAEFPGPVTALWAAKDGALA